MFKNYLKIAFRNLCRQKTYAFINVLGLSVGIASTILIGLYVWNELGYDRYNAKSDRLYRVFLDLNIKGNKLIGPVSPAPMAETLMKELPDVAKASRLYLHGNRAVRFENKVFYEDRFFYGDSNLFELFSIVPEYGDLKKSLSRPNSIVITDKTAERYFGRTDVVGKTLQILNSDSTLFEITAVVKEMPIDSHFHFDFLASIGNLQMSHDQTWLSNNFYTYILFKREINPREIEARLLDIFKTHAGPQLMKYMSVSFDDFMKGGNRCYYKVQKVTDIHLKSNLTYEIEPNGSYAYVYIFLVVALFIILNACINFTNLAIARSMNRVKEVGLRKVLGSSRTKLILQFLSESVLLAFISLLLSFLIIEITLPLFENMLHVSIRDNWTMLIRYFPVLLVFVTLIGCVAGSYPAFYLSAFNPVEIFRKKFRLNGTKDWVRNTLVIVQFSVSVAIILATVFVTSQLRYMQKKQMGFDRDQILTIERTDPIYRNIGVFISELRKCPGVESVSLSSSIPGLELGNAGFSLEGRPAGETYIINSYAVSAEYDKTMGIQMKYGRFFSADFGADSMNVVINESVARSIGIENPVGKRFFAPSGNGGKRRAVTIIGVMKDFNYESFHKKVYPLMLFLTPVNFDGYVNIRIAPGKMSDVLSFADIAWKNLSPEIGLKYTIYDAVFTKLYQKEIEIKQLLSVFSVIAILIAALGLLGMVSLVSEKRTKEIGIRKVMGSSVFSVVSLLIKDITLLVAVSVGIAMPLAYLWVHHWLTQFAYKTSIDGWIFVLAGIASFFVAWLTVIFQAARAAIQNPVDSLRYE